MINRIKKLFFSLVITVVLYLSIIYFQSCKQDFVNNPSGTIQFPAEIESIFNTAYTSNGNNFTCSTPSCHANGNNAGGMDLVDWQRAMNGSNNGTMIIPYNGYWSHIIAYLNKDTGIGKPPVAYIDTNSVFYGIHKIDPEKVTTIMNWINDGAKSKNGDVAFTNISNSVKGFITNQAADVVAVIKTDDKLVIRLIPVGGRPNLLDSPHYITVDPEKKYFYVSLIGEGFVEKYDINTFVQVGRMQAGQSPAHIVIAPDSRTGYITNFSTSNNGSGITRFNTETMTVTGFVNDPKITASHGMAITRDGKSLLVDSQIGEYIFKINTEYFEISDSVLVAPIDPTVPPGGGGTGNFKPYQIVLSPDDSLLYISCVSSNQVRIYRASDLVQINSVSVGKNPLLMNFTNDGRYVFVCNRNDSSVTVINAATRTVETTVTDAGVQPHGVDFTNDGQYAIIACETQSGFDGHHPQVGSIKPGTSRLIQISNFNLLPNRLGMGSFPAGIAIVK